MRGFQTVVDLGRRGATESFLATQLYLDVTNYGRDSPGHYNNDERQPLWACDT